MTSLYIWQYFLIVPADSLLAADTVAPALNNPDGIAATFRRYPLPDDEGEYLEPATHWVASFVATDATDEGNPSRESLEAHLGQHSALSAVLWVRCKNPHHPDTPEIDHNVVVASNWTAFPPGATCDWAAATAAIAP